MQYARDTQHEKIQRGLSLGIAMVSDLVLSYSIDTLTMAGAPQLMYGQLEEADTVIENLCRDKDPLLRRSGMFTIAMAYCGSGNNKAIKRLLHVAVSHNCLEW